MVKGDIEWWYDPQPYPGPPDKAWRLPWDDPMSAPVQTVYEILDYTQHAMMRSIEEASRTMVRQLGVVFGTAPDQDKPKSVGRVRNHGPRPQKTFDRRGNRNY